MKEQSLELKPIAYIRSDFPTKFGIPRQSGLVDTTAEIVFKPYCSQQEVIRGMEEYTHLWLIWGFSETAGGTWSPTVRPPRLGGNKRMGVFATRSPFRPNPVGLSCVRLKKVEIRKSEGPVLIVEGADLMNGTPIYDIKPYLAHIDAHPEAKGGFADEVKEYGLNVHIPERYLDEVPEEKQKALKQILMQDPRPAYQQDEKRVYGMEFAGMEVKFRVVDGTAYVCGIKKAEETEQINDQGEKAMKFIVAKNEHVDRMCEITDQAKRQLKGLGLDQWQKGYPSREVWLDDVKKRCAYLAVEEREILGIFAFQTTPDVSYYEIDGKWLTDGEYASMHRVCVADESKGKGVAGKMFSYGFEMAEKSGFKAVRIDTHPGNLPMQRALEKAGFVRCGTIKLAEGPETGDERIAFEKIL